MIYPEVRPFIVQRKKHSKVSPKIQGAYTESEAIIGLRTSFKFFERLIFSVSLVEVRTPSGHKVKTSQSQQTSNLHKKTGNFSR